MPIKQCLSMLTVCLLCVFLAWPSSADDIDDVLEENEQAYNDAMGRLYMACMEILSEEKDAAEQAKLLEQIIQLANEKKLPDAEVFKASVAAYKEAIAKSDEKTLRVLVEGFKQAVEDQDARKEARYKQALEKFSKRGKVENVSPTPMQMEFDRLRSARAKYVEQVKTYLAELIESAEAAISELEAQNQTERARSLKAGLDAFRLKGEPFRAPDLSRSIFHYNARCSLAASSLVREYKAVAQRLIKLGHPIEGEKIFDEIDSLMAIAPAGAFIRGSAKLTFPFDALTVYKRGDDTFLTNQTATAYKLKLYGKASVEAEGVRGQALELSGSSKDYARVEGSDRFVLPGDDGSFTVMCFVNPTEMTGHHAGNAVLGQTDLYLHHRGTDVSKTAGYLLRLKRGHAEFVVGANNWVSVTSPRKLPLREWTHLAVSYDGEVLRLYINGEPVGEKKLRDAMQPSTQHVILGRSNHPDERTNFVGRIDEVMLRQSLLSADEIKGVYELLKKPVETLVTPTEFVAMPRLPLPVSVVDGLDQ